MDFGQHNTDLHPPTVNTKSAWMSPELPLPRIADMPFNVIAVSESSAPTGPRRVATGEAARPQGRPTRNPWKRLSSNASAPKRSSAPTGPRIVATGEAPTAAQRAVRNPWKRSSFNASAPKRSSAPTGPRIVATGEAPTAVQRTVRNPWKRSSFNASAPAGRRNRRGAHGINRTQTARRTPRRGRGASAKVRI